MTSPWDTTTENTNNEGKKEIHVGNTEGKIVVTLKGGAGFEQPWIVVHANDLDEANGILGDVDRLGKLISLTHGAANTFRGGAAPSQGAPASRPAPRATPTSAPNGEQPPSCNHGDMVYRKWTKNGETKEAYFCPLPQDRKSEQCKPKWLTAFK